MITRGVIDKQVESIDKLSEFIEAVDNEFFDKKSVKTLSEKTAMERYKIAKESLLKNIDSIIKVEKEYKDITNEEQLIISAISSFPAEKKKKLKEFILNLNRE